MANSKKRCKHCKVYVKAETGIKVPAGFFCSHDHAIEFARDKQAETKRQQQKDRDRVKSMTVKDLNRKDVEWQHKQTQPAFNRLRVLEEILWFQDRGLQPECISCGSTSGVTWSCGHYKTVGANRQLRYERDNTFLQCWFNCNKNKSGNIQGTRTERGLIQGLYERFGREEADRIIDFCETKKEIKRWTWQELEENRAEYRKEIRRLEKLINTNV